MFERASRVIPLGSQTFSKSYLSYPEGESPLFLTHGQGAHVWDVDNNEYVDLVNGLLPNVLGYDDPDVTRAVIEQLGRGVTLSLATELEVILAEKLVELIPCAEMVRFGKNGSDATAGAIRVARAFTGRDRVAVCGYHGWQDWYIGSTLRGKGVPQAVRDLTHTFPYNDLLALDVLLSSHPGEFAAVMMEPMNFVDPAPGYLQSAKEIAHRHGALFIFDEIITGFRFHIGGAQSMLAVTPDLATFGKSMGNGFPIAAVVGRADIMREMEDIFFSFTFGGEGVSLAASIAAIEKMEREPVIETLWRTGQQLIDRTNALIAEFNLGHTVKVVGKPCWSLLQIADAGKYTSWELKTLFLQEVLGQGILTGGAHNICYAHTAADLQQIEAAYSIAFSKVRAVIDGSPLEAHLRCPAIQPIFKVRG
jgi:glutamate-1-semialdehyde 2,1-aminomutase/spore coat polysaccharide biosynthesis protein SpsF